MERNKERGNGVRVVGARERDETRGEGGGARGGRWKGRREDRGVKQERSEQA